MNTPYQLTKDELSAEDKEFLEMAYTVLMKGDHLYGTSPTDVTHIEWVMGYLVSSLGLQAEPSVSILEIGHDTEGFFVSLVMPET